MKSCGFYLADCVIFEKHRLVFLEVFYNVYVIFNLGLIRGLIRPLNVVYLQQKSLFRTSFTLFVYSSSWARMIYADWELRYPLVVDDIFWV